MPRMDSCRFHSKKNNPTRTIMILVGFDILHRLAQLLVKRSLYLLLIAACMTAPLAERTCVHGFAVKLKVIFALLFSIVFSHNHLRDLLKTLHDTY